jgi:hypothetical protein
MIFRALLLGFDHTTVDIQFTLPVGYDNVTIFGAYWDFYGSGDYLTAWLTTQIGPGTTVADERATTTLDPGAAYTSLTTVLSGLTLPAGTYNFVVTGTQYLDDEYSGGNSYTTVEAPGVSFQDFVTDGSMPGYYYAYPAASTFSSDSRNWNFQITGDPMAPEPTSFAMGALGCLGALGWSWSRRRARHRS